VRVHLKLAKNLVKHELELKKFNLVHPKLRVLQLHIFDILLVLVIVVEDDVQVAEDDFLEKRKVQPERVELIFEVELDIFYEESQHLSPANLIEDRIFEKEISPRLHMSIKTHSILEQELIVRQHLPYILHNRVVRALINLFEGV